MNKETYAIVRLTNKFNGREDIYQFLIRDSLVETPEMWGSADCAHYFSAKEIAAMRPEFEESENDYWIPDGCASPDDILIIESDIANTIAARNADMSLYDWDDYKGRENDAEAQGEFATAQDLALLRESAIAFREFRLSGELAEPRPISADEARLLTEAGYNDNALEGAVVIAEENSAKLYHLEGYGYAVEGETGEVIAGLDRSAAFIQWS